MKFKLDEMPLSSAAVLAGAGHDVDSVGEEGLWGAADPGVVAAATAAGRVLISLDAGLADIRAYPPGSREWLSSRGIDGVLRFPIWRFGSDNAPERRAMRGEPVSARGPR